jgi:multicomponent Na+:H+ antiporter subunit D
LIINNLPALQVIIPLLAAPVCAVVPYRKFAWLFTCIITFVTFFVSLKLAHIVWVNGAISYDMGNWDAPVGIEYRVDTLSAFLLVLISGIAAVTSVYSYSSVGAEVEKKRQPLFYAIFLLCLAGFLGISITNDLFNIFVFLEIASLASYALVAIGRDRRALMSAFEYLVLGTIGATFILIGIGLLYMMTGTLNISDLSIRVPPVTYASTVKAALAFFIVGLALKIGIFPLHMWLANAYTNSPSFVSSFLSGTASKVGIYVLLRVIFVVFNYRFSMDEMNGSSILITLALFTIFVGALVAIFQKNIKRMLAYSSISQMGYMLLGIGIVSKLGADATIVQFLSHSLAKVALFMAAGCVMLQSGSVRIEAFRGIAKTMPFTMAAFVIAGLSIIGLPLTAGFIGKWYLIEALVEKEMWMVLVAVVVSSLLSLVYIWRIIEVAYFSEALGDTKIAEAPPLMLISLWVLTIATIVFGIYPSVVIDFATKTSEYLFSL